jgi:hypothetical protein
MKLGLTLESDAASLVFLKMASEISQYNGLDYARLSETTDQWPIMGVLTSITVVLRMIINRIGCSITPAACG